MISIDEAIVYERKESERILKEKFSLMDNLYSFEYCKEMSDRHIQIAEWLEELKYLQEMKEAIECNAEVLEQQGYNKAIDDFVKKLEKNSHYLEGHYGAIYEEDIYNISVQLKVGKKHE